MVGDFFHPRGSSQDPQTARRRLKHTLRVLISPTAYKGTLTPSQAAGIMARAVRKKFPQAKIHVLPLADGGDGTLDVLSTAMRGKKISTEVTGPLGKKVAAVWSQHGTTAIIEMARASGLALVKGQNRIMEATSYGTGELIKAAMDRGCRHLIIGVGGTACAEGGTGALQALGLRYLDPSGRELSAKPKDLTRLRKIDWSGFDRRLRRIRITVLCDVTNPLLGPRGSARTFGPQKGATPPQVAQLERFLRRWSTFAKRNVKNFPGAGAAGALAFGMAGFAGAKLAQGTPFVLKTLRWNHAAKADLILTGEGKVDHTSFSGKVVGAVAKRRGSARVIVVCGFSALPAPELKRRGIARLVAMGNAGLKNPSRALQQATERALDKE